MSMTTTVNTLKNRSKHNMEMMRSSLILSTIEALQARLKGSTFIPGDAGYEQASQPWNLTMSHRPSVVVMAKNARDVVEAIRFAGLNDLGIAIQATGHGVSLSANNAVLINTSLMQDIRIDPIT